MDAAEHPTSQGLRRPHWCGRASRARSRRKRDSGAPSRSHGRPPTTPPPLVPATSTAVPRRPAPRSARPRRASPRNCAAPGRSAACRRSRSATSTALGDAAGQQQCADVRVGDVEPHVRGVRTSGRHGVSRIGHGDRVRRRPGIRMNCGERPRRLGADDGGKVVEHQVLRRHPRRVRAVDRKPVHRLDGVDAAARGSSGDHPPTRCR